ncbi:MAG: methyltransferase domain-containing protein [Candidatus Omnitrophica bacterium]|nr:methyltransferase domain-containing protein [Candidatus Omnitrophota bacterium]MBU1628176.1 methyltransferase domain-containing protein [bacterium]
MNQIILQCPICGHTTEGEIFKHYSTFPKEFFLRAFQESLANCKNCGLTCLYPQPTEEILNQFYDEKYLEEQKLHRPAIYSYAMNLFIFLVRHLRRKDALGKFAIWPTAKLLSLLLCIPLVKGDQQGIPKALDVGCSTGDAMRLLHETGWEVYGFDINKAAVMKARGLFPDNVFLGQMDNMHWSDEEFDLVRMSHVLEHLKDPIKTLTEIRRVLKVGGHLIVSVPNAGSLEKLMFQSTWHAWDFPHLWHFNRQTIKEILAASGFDPSSIRIHTTSTGFGIALRQATKNFDGFYELCLQVATWTYDTSLIRCLLFPLEQLISTIGLGNTVVATAYKSREGRLCFKAEI